MRRLRVLRILLPFALLVFLVVLAFQLRPPTKVHRQAPGSGADTVEKGEGLAGHQSIDGKTVLNFVADLVENQPDGSMHFRGIDRFEVYQKNRGPLIVSAEKGDVSGEPGGRVMLFESQVTIRDPEADLVLILPSLEVDEEAGEARSRGQLTLSGANLEGTASELIYGLEDQPSRLFDLELKNSDGGTLRAREALLHDGLDDVEFLDEVRAVRGEEHFDVDRLRVQRGPGGQPRQAHGTGNVRATMLAPGGLLELRCDDLRQEWDEEGRTLGLRLEGQAEIHSVDRSLAADTIEARRVDLEGSWNVTARGTVYVQGMLAGQPAWMRSERLDADLTAEQMLRRATIEGQVRIESATMRAEAERGSLIQLGERSEVRLFGEGSRKARLARDRTRVAANRITTDGRGLRLLAEESVEATLLPVRSVEETTVTPGLFEADEAVHFVAARLEGQEGGSQLRFEGAVRAWQGDRNLSAETVEIDQRQQNLIARENVTSRFPRDSQAVSVSEADYIQITADRLDYEEGSRQAVYEGAVRVRLLEGWLEAQRVEVDLGQAGEGIREVRAFDAVKMEFRDPAEEAVPRLVSGHADRLVYTPDEQLIHLYGETEPASVRRIGQGGETTRGRVLRYRLDSGALEVDSGEIRTSEK